MKKTFNEFKLIEQYFNRVYCSKKDVLMGIGDDCALLSFAEKKIVAVSVDTLVSGIHFLPDINPSDLAYKSLAVNLSDLAAMGANPAWLLLSITLPKINDEWLQSYSNSLFQLINHYDMQLIGGDVNCGPLSLTITIHGFIVDGFGLTRNGANIGDYIYVTGTLGDSAAGLAILQDRLQVNDTQDRCYLLDRHLRPKPRIQQGQLLCNIANSAIDISDGIIRDLQRILIRSNCGARINLDAIPLSSILLRQTSLNQALDWAINGGEDYELCFTVSKNNIKKLNIAFKNNDVSITCIGQIIPRSEGIKFMRHNLPEKYKYQGFDHFK